jgi:D-alanyl-lipoteichoic acid acyltransferase DltB (MBOAT superfamily)
MLFHSAVFFGFLPVVYAAYLLLRGRNRLRLLLGASYVFYGWWDWRFCFLLLLSTVVDYRCGAAMASTSDPSRRLRLLWLSILVNLGALGFFKYLDFFSDAAVDFLTALGMQADPVTLNVILPVGISFYTFQTLSYTVDVYRGHSEPARDFTAFAAYVAFFPQLVAGPIERASALLPQLSNLPRPDLRQVADGLWLMLLGYVKKVVIADRCAGFVDVAFAGGALPAEGAFAWTYLYAFALQIYGDFSGYTDIARGVSKLFGFELMRNFRAPYFVTNPSDFWRHWHISLSTWLRDYLYIGWLGGNRDGAWKTYRNLMLTMVLGGLWHGAGWAFLIWGLFHGALLVLHRPVSGWFSRFGSSFAARALGVFVFFHLTCIGWLIFRAGALPEGVNQAEFIFRSLRELLMAPAPGQREAYVVALAAFGVLTAGAQLGCDAMERFHAWRPFWQVGAVGGAMLLIAMAGVFGGSQFIYFQF